MTQAAWLPPIFSFKDLPRRVLVGRLLFFLLILLLLATSVICTVAAFTWIDKPFAGFLVNQRMVLGNYGGYGWTGTQAGIRYPDKIKKADDRPVSSMRDLEEVITATRIGDPIRYTVQRGRELIEVRIPTMRFTALDLVETFGITFLAGILYLVIGVIVFVLKPDTGVSWAFFAVCFFLSAYAITSFDLQSSHLGFVRLYLIARAFIPATVLHLSLIFPEPLRLTERHPSIQLLPYLLGAILVVPMEILYPRDGFLPFYQAATVYMVISAVALVASTLRVYFQRASVLARQRAKVVLFGAALAFPIPAILSLGALVGHSLGMTLQTNFMAIPVVVFPAAIAYAIVKHNLFDVDVFIKRTVGYGLMTVIVGTGYFAVHVTMRKFVLDPLFGAQAENVYPIIFALLVVFFFNPVNHRVQEGVDRLFFRKQYDFKATVGALSDALTSVVDLNEIIGKVIGTVRKEMFVDSAGIVLLDDRKKACQAIFIGDGPVNAPEQKKDLCVAYDDPLLALLAREKKLITKYDLAEDPQYEPVRESCGQRFAEIGASLALPLFYRDEFTGVLALGTKKSGHFYTREDIDLLKTVSSMTSTAIEQVREKGEKQMVMQLFSKHVSPEVAEAVWNEREQFLEGGRPRSQKLLVTVLFTDLKGFSTLSEKTDPQALMDLLNTYMDTIAKCVMDHGGVVDDYFGDGMKANFGVPLPRTTEAEIRQDAVNAVNAALAMEKEMIRLNARMQEQGLPTLKMRVGIYTGHVVAGSLGSTERMKYTTVGDTVNTASRLESFDKDLMLPHLETSPCRIIIGESTLRFLGDQFQTQRVGELSLKGKEEKITAHCVIGRATKRSPVS
jgi:class 3 adenylate cyclase